MATTFQPDGFRHLARKLLSGNSARLSGVMEDHQDAATAALASLSRTGFQVRCDWALATLLSSQWLAGAAALFSRPSHTAALEQAFFATFLMVLVSLFLVLGFAGRSVTRYAIAVTQIMVAALLPCAFGQGAESSLPFCLVALVLLAAYRDHRVLLAGGASILLVIFLGGWQQVPLGEGMRAGTAIFLVLAEGLALAFMNWPGSAKVERPVRP